MMTPLCTYPFTSHPRPPLDPDLWHWDPIAGPLALCP